MGVEVDYGAERQAKGERERRGFPVLSDAHIHNRDTQSVLLDRGQVRAPHLYTRVLESLKRKGLVHEYTIIKFWKSLKLKTKPKLSLGKSTPLSFVSKFSCNKTEKLKVS